VGGRREGLTLRLPCGNIKDWGLGRRFATNYWGAEVIVREDDYRERLPRSAKGGFLGGGRGGEIIEDKKCPI